MERQSMPGKQQQSGQQTSQAGGQHGTLYEPAPAMEAMQNYNHNLIQCLNEKLDAIWRYEKYIEDSPEDSCSQIYKQMMKDDMRAVQMLRDEISRHCQQNKFS